MPFNHERGDVKVKEVTQLPCITITLLNGQLPSFPLDILARSLCGVQHLPVNNFVQLFAWARLYSYD
jgi:hypothetical protein